MKTTHLKISALFVLISILISGCVEHFDIPQKTEKGKSIYDAWNVGVTTSIQHYVDVAFAFNAWHEASESQRDSIEDKYLFQYKVRNMGDDTWGLYHNSSLAYKIFRNNKSLSDADAAWIIEAENSVLSNIYFNDSFYSRYKFDSFLRNEKTIISLQTIATNEWNVKIADEQVRFSTMDINIKSANNTVPASLSLNSYSWNGSGCFAYLDLIYSDYYYNYEVAFIDFEVIEDIAFAPQKLYENNIFYWTNGKVLLNAFDIVRKDNVEVRAEFSKLTSSLYNISITCQGITEEWIEPKQDKY